jgi:hypothetical protein
MRFCGLRLALREMPRMSLAHIRRGLMRGLSALANFLLAWNTRALTVPIETPKRAAVSRFDNSPSSRSSMALRAPGLNFRNAADKICVFSVCK